MKIPSIVKGNDFTIKVYVLKPTYIDNSTEFTDFDLRGCNSIKVFLVNGADSYAVEYTIDEMQSNLIKVNVDFVLPTGSYGIEITGKDSSNRNWRFKAKKGELMNIIDATSGSDFNSDVLEDGLYVTAKVGILSMNMDNYYTKDEIESRLSNIDSLINNSDLIRRYEFEEATTIYDNSSYSYSPSTSQTFNYSGLNGYYNYYDAVQTIDITRTYAYTPSQGSTYIAQFTTEYSISPYSFPSGININWNAPIPESNVQIMFDFGTSRGYLTLDFYSQMQEYHEYEYSMDTQGAELTPPTHYFDYVNGGYFNGNYQYHLNLSQWPDISNVVIMANGNTIDLYDAGTYDSSTHYVHFESYSDNVGDGISFDIDFDNYVVNLISGIYPTYTFYGTSSINIVLPHTFTSWNINTNSNTVDVSGQGDSSAPVNPSGNNRRIKDVVIDIMNDLAYNYPTNSDIANAGYITSGSIDNFVTKDEINNAGYLTSHQSLDNYVTKDDINNASYLTEHQDLSSYVTYDYLSSQSYLTEHQSLDNYVTKSDINNASYVTSDYLSQQSYLTEHQSLNDYVTKSDLDNASYLTEHQDLSSYVTYDFLSSQSYLTQHQSLDNYVTKSDLDNASYLTEHQDLSSYVTYDFLSSQAYLQQHQDLSSYVTYDYLSAQSYLTQHQSLNGYATESWVNDKFEDILGVDADGISGIKEILEDNDTYTGILKEIVKKANAEDVYTKSDIVNASYVTSDYLSQQSYLQQHQSLDNYVTYDFLSSQSYLTQHQSLDNYVTKSDLDNASYLTEHQDLSSYVTYDFLSSQSYLTQHQSLDNYVTKSDLDNASYLTEHQDLSSYVTYDFLSSQSYLTQHQSLDNYVTKTDIENASYVTSDYLSQQSYLQQHQSLDNYVTKSDLENASYLTEHQDLSNYVTYDYLSSQSYLTEHQDLSAYVTYDYLSAQSYLTQHQSLDNYVTKEDLNNASYITEHQDLSSYVTYDYLSSQSYLTQHQSLDNYVTKTDLDNASYLTVEDVSAMGYITSHQDLSDYATKEEISNAGYLTSHQSLDNYYTKSDIQGMSYVSQSELSSMGYLQSHQSLSDYYTKTEINNAGYLTSHQSLSNYVTTTQLDERTLFESTTYSINVTSGGGEYILPYKVTELIVTLSAVGWDSIYIYTEDLNSVSIPLTQYETYPLTNTSGGLSVVTSDLGNGEYKIESNQEIVKFDWWYSTPIKVTIAKPEITVKENFTYYVSKEELSNCGYLTSHQSLSNYYTKTQINNMSYVSKSELSSCSYVTQSDLSSMGYLQSHQSLSNYYTKTEINNAGYLTSHQSLSNYATKTDISNASYVTQTSLSNMGYLTSHQSLTDYVSKTELSNCGYLTSHQSLSNYPTKTDISNMSYVASSTSGLKIEVVASLPASPDSNTIYIVQ